MKETIVIFGESEKGDLGKLIPIETLPHLASRLGNPTKEGLGIHLAIQAMLNEMPTLFFRVDEEGEDVKSYMHGLKLLKDLDPQHTLTALALPGVGTKEILDQAENICKGQKALLIMNQRDLYDLLTE